MRPENVEEFFGGEFANLSDVKKGEYALPIIANFLNHWMRGLPLREIEALYPNGGDPIECKRARHFVLRMVPDLAFFAGLPARLLAAREAVKGSETSLPVVIATLGATVREGCDSPECLAIRVVSSRRTMSRVAARARFEGVRKFFEPGEQNETFEETVERARYAIAVEAFDEIDLDS